jgi:type IV pilus assembly protein PilE
MAISTRFYKQSMQGFSLIELMIVVTIIGILGVIAYPMYQNYVQHSRRTDAMSGLIRLESAQENYRFSHTGYGTLVQVQATATDVLGTSPLGYYTLTVSLANPTSSGYTVTAVATGAQASDTTCATMSINLSNGVETKSPAACWTGY